MWKPATAMIVVTMAGATAFVGAKFYNVPDTTRKRVFEVHALPEPIQIVEAGQLIAVHPVLEGRHQPARTGSGDG